ncbi:MAG: amino acid adenylation domain-containing protein, partial [Niveispirillum sp.]|nr:amino acid adenylation domain-containing protein [Niveispirillum sp.]
MRLDQLLAELRALDITLSMQGDELKVRAAKGKLTQALTDELRARKAELISYLTQAAELAAPLSAPAGTENIPRAPLDQLPLLSFGQQRLWFLDQLEGPSATYTMPMAIRLDGDLDAAALDRALVEVIRRHEVLRCTYILQDRQPCLRAQDVPSTFLVCKPAPTPGTTATDIVDLIRVEATLPFDLSRDLLLRATLIPQGEGTHLLLVTMHHIASDGWSLEVFLREMTALYTAFRQGQPSPLPPLPVQYRDFAHWQKQRLQGPFLARTLAFWRDKLAGAPDVLSLPIDRPRRAIQTYQGAGVSGVLEAGLAGQLRTLSQENGSTLFMTLLAGFAVLLSRCCGQRDILIGTPVANRTRPEFEPLIGLFINTLVLRVDVDGQAQVRDLLAQVRQTCVDAFEHQDLPFEQLVDELKPARTLSHAPLVQVAIQLGMPMERIDIPGLTLSPIEQPPLSAKFDLHLTVEETGGELLVLWTYNPDLFDQTTIEQMTGRYRMLLTAMAGSPTLAVAELPVLDNAERHTLLAINAKSAADYPRDRTLVTLIEDIATRLPDHVALVFDDQCVTYRQLMRRVDRVARTLRHLGVGPEVLVALCVERSAEMVIGLLGIMKAGGAYVPLDPTQPAERLSLILEDACPSVMLTLNASTRIVPPAATRVIALNALPHALPDDPALSASWPGPAGPGNTAYVIYTSGSTGRPKGVRVGHRGLVNLLVGIGRDTGFTSSDRLLAITTIGFDIAALEIFLPLITGACVVIAPRQAVVSGSDMQTLLQEQAINWLQGTPATFRLLLDTGWSPPPGVTALCGGEALPVDMARGLVQRGVRLWNVYGPTETTIWSTARQVNATSQTPTEGVEPIGGALANTSLYVIDSTRQLAPLGVAGELCIGGDGLALGYLRRPNLTADHYIPDPFSVTGGARLYRTGDLVRQTAAGTFQFLGRTDYQVKIRGYRIELGEVEAALREHPAVKDCVVLAREDRSGDKRLAAYLVVHDGAASDVPTLRAYLSTKLPDYMVPNAFVTLAGLPLNPTGKIDRRALPAPVIDPTVRPAPLVVPERGIEARIAAVWRQVLGRESVGVDDNFFDLGGHSLLLTQVHEALRPDVGKPFPLVTLFQYPTIRRLGTWMTDGLAQAIPPHTDQPQDKAGREIAIVGMAGRFPGADDLERFWANLCAGTESIRFFSNAELVAAGTEPALLGLPNYVRANGTLSDVAGFDAGFFG